MRPTIVIADDEPYILDALSLKLRNAGYEVAVAEDGEAALALARASRPLCVIADLGMPKMDGYALCGALRADEATREVPVLILTARESEPESGLIERLRIHRFFTKPFSPREILATVQEIERARPAGPVSAAPASGTRSA